MMLRGFDSKTAQPGDPSAAAAAGGGGAKAGKSRASLASLSLATKQTQPLQVPAHAVLTPSLRDQDHFFSHLVPAAHIDDHLLHARIADPANPGHTRDQYYILGNVLKDGRGALVRGMRKPDEDVHQVYMVKEIPLLEGSGLGAGQKTVDPEARSAALFELMSMAQEVNIQASIAHPMTPHFELVTHDKLYLVMPQMGADVSHVLRNVSSEQNLGAHRSLNMSVRTGMAFNMLDGVAKSLALLHGNHFAHGDIKLENMALRQDGDVYLIDFNSATLAPQSLNEGLRATAGSTVGHGAPEAQDGQSHDARKADMWSLGVALLATLLADNPFVEALPPSTGVDGERRIFNRAFYQAWQARIEGVVAEGSAPSAMAQAVDRVHEQLQQHAAPLYPILLRLLDGRPSHRISAPDLRGLVAKAGTALQPQRAKLSHELQKQYKLGRMPIAQAIAQDARLMHKQPGERGHPRPTLRRANSVDTLLRPFVQPFTKPAPEVSLVEHARAQEAFKFSPRFAEVEAFLAEQDERLGLHLMGVPDAAERLYNAPLPSPWDVNG